jgi:hypothetical protein
MNVTDEPKFSIDTASTVLKNDWNNKSGNRTGGGAGFASSRALTNFPPSISG